LVYFDLEATGLKSSGKPRISEISLVAVNVEDVLQLHYRLVEHLSRHGASGVEDLVPRVLNKLTLCVYPMATIMPVVTNITGLDNYNLTGQARFDKNTVDLLNNFLKRLPAPVCLVAHNGDEYDFQLLKSELENVEGELGQEIYCADSYVGFRHIFQAREDRVKINKNLEAERELDREVKAVTELMAAGEFDAEMDVDISEETNPTKKRNGSGQEVLLNNLKISKLENESTPKKRSMASDEPQPIKLKQVQISSVWKSRKRLKFPGPNSPPSYSLINIHKHLLGVVPSLSHGAEADCLALLRTSAMLGQEWVDWVNNNSYVFMDCMSMWQKKS